MRLRDRLHEFAGRLRGDRVHFVGHTMFGRTRVVDCVLEGERVRLLEVEGSEQSAAYLDERWCVPPFAYLRTFDRIFETHRTISSILMLGGGAMAYPRHIVAHHPDVSIEVTEIDPDIIRLARRYFFLDRLERTFGAESSGRLTIRCSDAAEQLLRAERSQVRYDAIINDCFQALLLAPTLLGEDALSAAHACLVPGGLHVTNVVGTLSGDDYTFASVMGALSPHFDHICALPTKPNQNLARYGNICVVASDEAIPLEGAIPLRG